MKRTRMLLTGALIFLASLLLVLSGCPGAGSSSGTVSIVASTGTLTGSGSSWTFDAGTVPQYATESVTFTVTNTESSDFTATGSLTFTNSDFATDLGSSFTAAAGSSNTFTATFTPTEASGEETGTLTLTPTSGTAIVITLKGTPDQSFQVYNEYSQSNITPPNTAYVKYNSYPGMQIINGSSTATVTLPANPVTITGDGFSVDNQPSDNNDFVGEASSIPASTEVYFRLIDSNTSAGNSATLTISGTSTSGAPFVFTCTLMDQADN